MNKAFISLIMAIGILVSTEMNAQTFQQVTDINNEEGSQIEELTVVDNQLFFRANDGVTGNELWVSDGTEEGTELVKDFNPNGNGFPRSLTAYEGQLVFAANESSADAALWISDGTESGTQMLTGLNSSGFSFVPSQFTLHNGKLYYVASDESNGEELWVTDGTESGTELVKDIYAGESGSDIRSLTSWEGELYFAAKDGINGYELWNSDGSESGTELLVDIIPGSGSGFYGPQITQFIPYNGELYFAATDGVNGVEVWKTNNTTDSTQMVADINPGSDPSRPFEFTVSNNLLFFKAENDIVDRELWVTDGTEEGTELVKDINEGGSSFPENFTEYNETLFFSATTPEYGFEPWISDGSAEGTQLFTDINSNGPAEIPFFRVMLGHLYFAAKDGINDGIDGYQLWRSDGTVSGTEKLSPENLSPGDDPLGSFNEDIFFVAFDETIYLAADFNEDGRELWKLEDQNVGLSPENSSALINIYPVPASNQIYFDLQKPMDLYVVDASGRVVKRLPNKQSGHLDISDFEAGMYIVVNPATGLTERFIKN